MYVYIGVGDIKISCFGGGVSVGVCLLGFFFDELVILLIVEMGFLCFRVEEVFCCVGENSIELVVEWLFSNLEVVV